MKMVIKGILLGFAIFLMVMTLVNTFGFLTFRKSDARILAMLSGHAGYQAAIDSVSWDGRRITFASVRASGEINRQAVIFVHGAPGSLDACLPFLTKRSLFEKADLYALDRPGYGASDFGRTMSSMAGQAMAIRKIIESQDLGPVVLVGHSLGGPVIARFAMDFPELTAGLVFVSASLDPALEPSVWWRKVVNFPLFRPVTPVSLRVCNQEIIPLGSELEKMKPLWSEVRCPVVFVHGTEDNLVPAENVRFARDMLVSSPGITVDLLEQEGHFIFWSKTDRVLSHVLAILDGEKGTFQDWN